MKVTIKKIGSFWAYTAYKNGNLIKEGLTPIINLKKFDMTPEQYITCFVI